MQRINANANLGLFVTTKKFIAPMQLLLPPIKPFAMQQASINATRMRLYLG